MKTWLCSWELKNKIWCKCNNKSKVFFNNSLSKWLLLTEHRLKNWPIGSPSLQEGKLNSLLNTHIERIWKYRGWLMKMIIWWIRFSLRKIQFSISRNRSNSFWIMRTKILKNMNWLKIKFPNKMKRQIIKYFSYKMKLKMLKYKDNNCKIIMLNNAANSKSKSFHWKTSMNNCNISINRN